MEMKHKMSDFSLIIIYKGDFFMKPYDQLTPGGKKRRLRKVVQLALEKYNIDFDYFEYMTEETSIFYKVFSKSGEKYALKIFQDASSTMEDNLCELFLIDTIAQKTDLKIPEVVKTKDKEGIVLIESVYTPTPKRITLYKWLEGIEADENETDDYFFKLGQMTAKLHEATKDVVVPSHLKPKRWDQVFYYRGEEAVYKEEKYQNFIDETFHETMDFVIPFLNDELKKYYKDNETQLIHGDLNPFNVMIDGDDLNLLDFEEAMDCLPVHDLGILLYYYRFDDNFDYEKVKRLVFDGYKTIRPLPDFTEYDIELLIIARRVNFLNYVLTFEEVPVDFIKVNIPRVREFLKKYVKACPF